jgi:putative Ca2+/H+ antiporter (TMEM165/GDT1 family)
MLATVMAMRYNHCTVFLGAFFGLVLMTGLSCMFGYILPKILPVMITQIATTTFFFIYGFFELYQWKYTEKSEAEEVELEMATLHEKMIITVNNSGDA